MHETNPELDRDVVKVIIETLACKNSPITYGDMAKIIGDKRSMQMSSQSFGFALGRIQDYCKELRLPSLPVMVINAHSEIPNTGFIEYYREIYPDKTDLSDGEIIREERRNCLACKDWQKLYDYVEIHEVVPEIVDVFG